MSLNNISVIGCGAWGTALAITIAKKREVILCCRDEQFAKSLEKDRVNHKYLPDINLPDRIKFTGIIEDNLNSKHIFLVIPSQSIRNILLTLRDIGIKEETSLIICSKGIEQNTLKLMGEIAEEILPRNKLAILSGPNFAGEIARGLPAISSLACVHSELAAEIADYLSNSDFRIYLSKDVIGVQIIGSVKNVIAIASGITVGKNLGENAKASLISRSIYEVTKLIEAMDGKKESLFEPAGIGDFILTCGSPTSRNMAFGIALAKGEIHVDNKKLVEGVATAKSVYELAKKLNIEMPICETIYNILYNKIDIETAIKSLLSRPHTSW